MRVLQINSYANSGSTGRIAEGIGNLILEDGGESFIAYGRFANKSQSTLIKIGNKYSQFLHLLVTRLFDLHGRASIFSTKKLIKEIDSIRPDIVHLHNLHGYYINYPLLFKFLKKSKIKVVWTLHDCWAFTGHCSHFVSANCNKWIKGCFQCPLKNEYPKSMIDGSKENWELKKREFTSLNNLTIVSPSKWLESHIKNSFLNQSAIMTINNGVDLNVFKNNNKQIFQKMGYNNNFIILGVSNVWNKQKGFNDFLRLSEIIPVDFKIIMVGLTENQIKKLPSNILGIKKTESVLELAEMYSSANVFFNPTYEETFSMTNVESLACGTPVVTYNTGGSPEVINERTGFVTEQGDLKNVLQIFMKIREEGIEYKQSCRSRAESFFDQNHCFNKYLQLYKKLLLEEIRS